MNRTSAGGLSFPHHTFSADEPMGAHEFVGPEVARAIETHTPNDVGSIAQALRESSVTGVILVHGTFSGNDIIGLMRELARFSPSAGRQIGELGKRWLDELVGENGNYAQSFSDCFSNLINSTSSNPLPVRRFHWSGENHHLGRADGAMSLLDLIDDHVRDHPGGRLLLFAHSHGGNVIAMLSQILAADRQSRQALLHATGLHYRALWRGQKDLRQWKRMEDRLLSPNEAPIPPLDVVTFGTPLRYRWNTDVCPRLLHFIQHRSMIKDVPERAALPNSVREITEAAGGDYIQQLGISGTDFLPSFFACRDWVVERRMHRIFEGSMRRRDLLKHLSLGRRVACDGTTLLVDYARDETATYRKLFGHGLYTCHQWLPFHLREAVERFYG